MFCDCLNMLPNGNFRSKVYVNTYADGICENCHHYASASCDYKARIDADYDATRSATVVNDWHREVKKAMIKKAVKKLSLDDELQLIQLGTRGVINRKLSEMYGISTVTVTNIFRRHGIKRSRGFQNNERKALECLR